MPEPSWLQDSWWPPMPENDGSTSDLAVALAQLKEQIRSVASSVEEIKSAVGQVVALDRTIAELSIHNQNLRDDVKLIWNRVDEAKADRDKLERAIEAAEAKTDALANRAKGALWAIGVLLGAFQAIVLASMAWVFTHVSDADVTNRLQQQRIEQLEAQQQKGQR